MHSIITVAKRTDHLALIRAEGVTPGARRRAFVESVGALTADEAAVSVYYGSSFAAVNKDGARLDKGAPWSGLNPSVTRAPAGAAPLNKIVNGLRVPCGVCLILAGGGQGKTPLAHALASHGVDEYSTIRVGEPLAGYTSDPSVAASGLAAAIVQSSDIVLDSIKDLLSGGGSAMKSGLSRDALVTISSWASLACDAGCTIYVPVNPSTPDTEVLELLAEISRSNATSTIVAAGANRWAHSSRTGEGLPRTTGSFVVDFDQEGFAKLKQTQSDGVSQKEFSKYVTTVLSTQAWSQAQRRAITSN